MDELLKFFSLVCCCGRDSSDAEVESNYYVTAKDKELQDVQDVRIGAFNIQRLGAKKFNNDFVVDNLIKIISRYDFLLVQEVQDEEEEYIPGFLEKLNEKSGNPYGYVISDILGRKTYKEQYLYIYRNDIFQIADTFHYDDGSEELGEDTFMREPFIVLLKSGKTSVGKLAVIGAHIQPKAVQEELNEMVNVHKIVIEKWGDIPVVIMGDFNAGGSYLSKTKLRNLEMMIDDKFHWLLDNIDTTVGKNEYTYDRIIVTGDELVNSVLPNTATAFNFEEEYGLSKEEALSISDHYPVEFVMGKAVKDEL